MLTKAITYVDYNGEKKTKNFYFALNRFELTKMHYESEGGLQFYLKKIIESNDVKEIFHFFEEFVLACYGEKSSDGETFIKNDDIRMKFKCHPAYDILMMEFIEGGDKAMSDFVNAVIPKEVADQISKMNVSEETNNLIGFEVSK